MAVHRYLLLATASTELGQTLSHLLREAGVSDPLRIVASDVEAASTMNQRDHEPPIAVFVDVADLADPLRLIGWIVASPTTRLIPVFAIIGSKGPQASQVEDYRPTAIISQPLDLPSVARCVALSPLLRGSKKPGKPPPPAAPPRGSPPFSMLISL